MNTSPHQKARGSRLRESARLTLGKTNTARSPLLVRRCSTLEAQLVAVLYECHAAHPVRPNLTEIAQWFSDRYGWMYRSGITARLIGLLLRNDLGIKPGKSCHGTVIPAEEEPKLVRLYRLHGFDPTVPPTKRGRYLQALTWVL